MKKLIILILSLVILMSFGMTALIQTSDQENVKLILNDQYKLGEPIEIKVQNNLRSTIYEYGGTNFFYNGKILNIIDPCKTLPMYAYLIGSREIKSGESKAVMSWDQNVYPETCENRSEQGNGKQTVTGVYDVTFSYSKSKDESNPITIKKEFKISSTENEQLITIPTTFSLDEGETAKVTNYQDMEIKLINTNVCPPGSQCFVANSVNVGVYIPGGCGPNADPRCLGPPSHYDEYNIFEKKSIDIFHKVNLAVENIENDKAEFKISFIENILVYLNQKFNLELGRSVIVKDYNGMWITYSGLNKDKLMLQVSLKSKPVPSPLPIAVKNNYDYSGSSGSESTKSKVIAASGSTMSLVIGIGEKKSVFGATISLLDLDNNGMATLIVNEGEIGPPTTICNACVNGKPTGKYDENGCMIYECPPIRQKECRMNSDCNIGICPDGSTYNKYSCSSDGKCIENKFFKDPCETVTKECPQIGYREKGKYCNINYAWEEQRNGGESCDNNFECSSNSCLDSKCTEPGFWIKLNNWLAKFFGQS